MFKLESEYRGQKTGLGQVIFLKDIETRLEAELFGMRIVQITGYSWTLLDNEKPLKRLEAQSARIDYRGKCESFREGN